MSAPRAAVLRAEVGALALLLAAIAAFYLSTLRPGTYWGDDFAQFILHARNLARGTPYNQLPFVTEVLDVRPFTYPPVFPLMLAPVIAAFGVALTPMKVEEIGLFVAALGVVWVAFRHALTPRSRLILVAVIGMNPFFWDFKDAILSDFPLMLLVYITLVVIERCWAREPARPVRWPAGVLLGLLIYLAYGTRTLGLLLLPVIVAYSLLRFRRITRVTWMAGGVCVALAVLQERLVPSTSAYLGFYGLYNPGLGPAWRALLFYTKELSQLWDPGSGVVLRAGAFALMSTLAAIGCVAQCRRRVRSYEIFAVLYLVAIVAWPGWQGLRYLCPVVPLYLAYVFGGVEAIGRFRGRRAEAAAVAAVLGAVALTYGLKYSTIHLRAPLDTATPEAQGLFRFIRTETPPDAVVEFPRPRALALFGERRTFEYLQQELTENSFWADLRRGGVTYLTTSAWDGPAWKAFVSRQAPCWDEVYGNPQYQVYRIRPGIGPGDPACPIRIP